jgi:hypothetical protein
MEPNKKVLSILERVGLTLFSLIKLIIVFKIKTLKGRCEERSSVTDYQHKYSMLDVTWYDYRSLVNLVKNTDFFNEHKVSCDTVICHFENSIYSILDNNGVFTSPRDVNFDNNSIGFSLYDNRLKRQVIGFIYFFSKANNEVKYYFAIDTKRTNKMQHIWSILKLKQKVEVKPKLVVGPPPQIERKVSIKREPEAVVERPPAKQYKYEQWFEDTDFSKMKFEELTDNHVQYLFSVLNE